MDDEQIGYFQTYVDSVDIKNCDVEDKEIVQNYQKLKEINLLYNPYLHLENENSQKVIVIFEVESKYRDVLIATREEMLSNDESIYVNLNVINIVNDLYLIKDVISVKIVAGYSGFKSQKFVIEDYKR